MSDEHALRGMSSPLSTGEDVLVAVVAERARHGDDENEPGCAHDGDRERKFGGGVVCTDCRAVIGDWRTVLPATPTDAEEATPDVR